MADQTKKLITQESIMKTLDACYEKCLNGIPVVSPNVEELANDYLKKHKSKDVACKAMLKAQIAKCTTLDLAVLLHCLYQYRQT